MEDLNAEIAPKKAAIASKRAQIASRSRLSKGLVSGGTVLTVVFAAATAYLVYRDFRDMLARYKVTYTVIPRYMVDSADIIGYNEYGEKIVLKNQSAYYKAVLCNRKSGDEWYGVLGSVGDLNGIHMFGSYTAFNLNSALYCWNGGAPEIYVSFKTDAAPAGVSGSFFSPGTAAIFGFGGIAVGALATVLVMALVRRQKKEPAEE